MQDIRLIKETLRTQGLNNPMVMAFTRFDGDPADGSEAQR
jgi:hypothetical protein